MTDERLTDREITLMFERIDEKLDRIEAQTIKTNGRVSMLEERVNKGDMKWAAVSAVVAVITFLGLPNVVSVLAQAL